MRKKIIYTDHALERLTLRGITEEHVRSAVLEPSVKIDGHNPGTTRVWENISRGKCLEVVYKEKKTAIVVITAYWR
jgi:hypothetical protein